MSTSSEGRIVMVTGGNRGLGLEVCTQLAKQGYRVILSARNENAAAQAAAELGAEHLQLDISDEGSITRAAAAIKERYGHLDVLVNNAAISMNGFNTEVARKTIAVNTYGSMAVTDALWPLLAEHASVVMVSSGMGDLSCLSTALQRDFEEPLPSREQLVELLDGFVDSVTDGSYRGKGWPGSAYSVSKVGLNAYTRIVAREHKDDLVMVNAVCPGWVQTSMGGAHAPRNVQEGAASILWAATLPASGPSGGFFRDGEQIAW